VNLRIEKLRRRDLRQLFQIENKVFPEPWTPAVFNSELALRKGRLYRAAWEGSDMAGYIGFLMIVDALRTLRGDGIKHISLEVAANNDAAQSLYRRFGFAPVAVRKNYYPVTGQDAVVMWAYDIDSDEYTQRLEELSQTAAGVD
jgi:ribosomal-protein-alanine N-acetyltransferase